MKILYRIGLLAGLSIELAASTAVFADELASTATLGDITFNYSPESWRIESGGDGLVATCVQEDCWAAVLDITRREGEAGCTEEEMRAEAERLFPVQGRAYANILSLGRFALVLAERHDGPELSSPEFAYGCLVWQDYEYRFATRPETVGSQSWIGGALAYLVSRATAPEAPVRQIRIGDITFALSTEQWRISHGEADGTVWLDCRMPTCGAPNLRASITVRDPAVPCPSPLLGNELQYEGNAILGTMPKEMPDGLDFTTATFHLGCRNYVAPRFTACTVHDGRSYHLSTVGAQSCRGSIWEIPESALRDFLTSARVVE